MEIPDINTTEKNNLIAEFMPNWDGRYYHVPMKGKYTKLQLEFHTSFDWLMPVVDKIESLPNEICIEYFWNKDDAKKHNDFRIFRVPDIKQLYEEVLGFITWYNENK